MSPAHLTKMSDDEVQCAIAVGRSEVLRPQCKSAWKSRRVSRQKSPTHREARGSRYWKARPYPMNVINLDRIELWRPVVDYVGFYSISTLGHVWSEERTVTRKLKSGGTCTVTLPGRLLATPPNAHGYPNCNLFRDSIGTNFYVHDLVAGSFLGPKPEGLEVCHRNDRKIDNRLVNLYFGTHGENMRDAVRNGRNHNAAKATCLRNHPFSPSNTYVKPSTGSRSCRECKRVRQGVAA